MPGGHFHMGRKSKYSAAFKLMIIHEAETSGIIRTSKKYSLADHTIRTWKLIYKYQGLQGLEPIHSNNTYSREYKESLVEEYQKSDEKLEELETLVQGAINYFNRKRAYASKNGLTAEQFRNQAVSC